MGKTDAEYIAELERLFRSNAGLGSLGSPRKDGFLAIAKLGKECWNAWRKAHRGATADFSAQGSSSFKGIDFSGFEFPTIDGKPCVDFSSAHLGPEQKFEGATFGDDAKFDNTEFGGGASFANASFLGSASFLNVAIRKSIGLKNGEASFLHGNTDFRGCRFDGNLDFSPREIAGKALFGASDDPAKEPVFLGEVKFGSGAFRNGAEFRKLRFKKKAFFAPGSWGKTRFSDALFEDDTDFSEAEFATIEFIDTDFLGETSFKGAKFNGETLFRGAIFFATPDFSAQKTTDRTQFQAIRFLGCLFMKGANFRDRDFQSTTIFGSASRKQRRNLKIFYSKHGTPDGIRRLEDVDLLEKTIFQGIPDFIGCKFHADTSFSDTEFKIAPGPETARAFRAIRRTVDLEKSSDEMNFLRHEVEAERPELRTVSAAYWTISGYGQRLARPTGVLFSAMLIFGMAHGVLVNLRAETGAFPDYELYDPETTWRWIRYVLINTFPVPGFDKTQMELRDKLFGIDGGIAALAMLLEMLHKLVSLGCVFLLGLALRNIFKMKS